MRFFLRLARLESQSIRHHPGLLMSMNQSYASIAKGRGGDNESKAPERGRTNDNQAEKSGKDAHSAQSTRNRSPDDQHKASNSNSKSNSSRNHDSSPSSQQKSRGAYTAEEYQRSQYHIPNTRANRKSPSPNGDREEHYVVTLLTDQALHNYMTKLRKKYFPPEINRLDAHITLFHALPGSHLGEIVEDIRSVCSRQTPFPVTAEEPISPRMKNILVNASSPRFAIQGVQKLLKGKWSEWLSEQDGGGFRPHYTISNKVNDENEVKKMLEECKEEFETTKGQVQGLVLWRYDRGNWRDKKVFKFGESEKQDE